MLDSPFVVYIILANEAARLRCGGSLRLAPPSRSTPADLEGRAGPLAQGEHKEDESWIQYEKLGF